MPHVFVSYMHANEADVRRLCDSLEANSIEVWLDRDDIAPGIRWKQAIRRAIQNGSFFIACFSEEYYTRDSTHMNEELTLAIEELRKRHTDRVWFIPVLLSNCDVPDRDIGAGETLRDFQHVDLYRDWNVGIQKIISIIQS